MIISCIFVIEDIVWCDII